MDYMDVTHHPVYEMGPTGPSSESYQYKEFKPETMRSFEVGYKAWVNKKLLVDAYGYWVSTRISLEEMY